MESSELPVVTCQRDFSSSGVSWGAVIAGAFVAAALSLIMLALGAGFRPPSSESLKPLRTPAKPRIRFAKRRLICCYGYSLRSWPQRPALFTHHF